MDEDKRQLRVRCAEEKLRRSKEKRNDIITHYLIECLNDINISTNDRVFDKLWDVVDMEIP